MIAAYDEAKKTPFNLLDLPDEILVAIIECLDYDALLNAIHVSKHFYELAEPFVYESITILHGGKAVGLSRSLARDRRRAACIRSLLVSTKFGQESSLFRLPTFFRLMTNIQDLRLETPDCNNKKPEDRVLWVELQDYYEKIFRQSSLLVCDSKDRLLPNLKSCALHFVDNNTELYSLSRYASIFLHPTIEVLTISCMSTDFPEKLIQSVGDLEPFKRSTALRHLHLEECDIHPPTLEVLLSLPRALKSLKISEGIRYDGVFRAGSSRLHGNMKPRQFGTVLSNTCKDTLESLSLSLGYLRSFGHDINHAGQYLKLNELEALKHLEVNNRTLNLLRSRPNCDHNTWKRFPPSLETLKVCGVPLMPPVHDTRQTYIPISNCFVKDKAMHGVPNLKTVTYSYEHYKNFEDDDLNFNDLLLNMVYNDTNNFPPPQIGDFAGNMNQNTIVNLLQQAANPINPPPPQQSFRPQPAAGPDFVTAAMNPNLEAPPQNIEPPRFRWRTGARGVDTPPELSRKDSVKLSLINVINENLLPDFQKSQTRLQIDLVTLPRGFIPPYLFPEDKPRMKEGWYDSRRPRTAADFVAGVRRRQARHTVAAHAAAVAYSSSGSSQSSSPAPVSDYEAGGMLVFEDERERSRNVFMQRMRDSDLDDDWLPENAAGGAEDMVIDDENTRMEVEDMLEMLRGEATSGDLRTDDDTDTSSGSVYLDAETEVSLFNDDDDADEDDDEEEDDDDDDDGDVPMLYTFS